MAEEKEKPLTRKDVLKAIKEHGGTAEGLDLSRETFEEGIDLSGFNREDLNLSGIKLSKAQLFRANFNGSNLDAAIMQGANLQYATFNPLKSKAASLQGVDLRNAYLQNAEFKEADLSGAQFQKEPGQLLPAYLENTDFRGAKLFRANFTGCYFYGTKLEGAFIRGADITIDTRLGDADWGNYVIGEEKKKDFYSAEHRYRHLKMWYTQSGYYDIAGEFLFREMEAKRKNLRWLQPQERRWLGWWPLRGQKVRLNVYKWLYGYGERPWRVLAWAALVVFLVACAHFFTAGILTLSAFGDSLYYSAVSFTALGYGRWAPQPTGWVKGLGAFEAFVGVFMIALFLITFVRKMTR